MRLTIKLGSTLRVAAPNWVGGEGELELPEAGPVPILRVMQALGLTPDNVNLVYRNHRLVTPGAAAHDGDRIALFPPNFIHFSQFYLKRDEQ